MRRQQHSTWQGIRLVELKKMEQTATFSFYDLDITTVIMPESYIDYHIYEAVKALNILICSIIFVLGTVGNGLVIWIAGFKMAKTMTIIWFLNLAIADFLFNICLPLQIIEWVLDGHWPFGQFMCKAAFTALFLNMSVSTLFVMIISIDRCTTVMFPVWSKNHRTPKLAFFISSCVWTVCFLLSSPYLAFFNVHYDSESETSYCLPIYSKNEAAFNFRYKAMLIIKFIAMFLVPFSVILICYGLIARRLRQSRSLSKSNRPFRIIVAIVLCFFCLWFPHQVWPFLEFTNVDVSENTDFLVSNLFCVVGFVNSCVNPLIYAFVGRDVKKSLNRSMRFLLESTFQEKNETDTNSEHNMVETEMETYN